MQDSTEPSLIEPGATETRCDPVKTYRCENHCAPQNIVAANFVEISQVLKPDSADEEQEAAECSPEDEDQDTLENDLLPSQITRAAFLQAYSEGRAASEVTELWQKYQREYADEQEAERLAQEDWANEEDEEEFDEEGFAQKEPSEPEPDYRFRIQIGGTPAKMAQLTAMEDLIRPSDSIQACHFVGAEDGIIKQFCGSFKLPWDLRMYQPLYDRLILPTGVKGFGTTRDLFEDISSFLQKHVMLPRKECSLLAYWAISRGSRTIFLFLLTSSSADRYRQRICCFFRWWLFVVGPFSLGS